MDFNKHIRVKDDVADALAAGKAVVALESTIISHGMPYPKNVETAKTVERIVRDGGAVPATIAILGGKIKIGLEPDELEYLGTAEDVLKASRRDLGHIVANGLNGATTVAATMIAANLAGIRVFVTGGIGGVHRGAENSFDISADLQELSNTDVAVICAGAKSILDIGLTLEYLETMGVPVAGFRTNELPAFYTRHSGFNIDYQYDTAAEVAASLQTKWDLGLHGGMVIGNPIPEQFEMDPKVIDGAINQALNEADARGIKGKETTPFLLDRVKQLTGGDSLESNIELVYNNARVGTAIAVELANL
ncbi:MAG: pseudouridine-5'-phosphate glycosidase [Spirochaetales bacterium]|uniref:Pseudouridine-5'-phosphate glycosidase n=1 Tax=Candidatus Thalassospirochaeta sargassi TaxID=3119039 RepID=A0AAJ1IBP1_9SPIO|nr:pseudouridine-5'-phosphate glycosidase [Spirochaetales bacterium]